MGAQDRRCNPTSNLEVLVDADLDTLAIELYVRTDDLLKAAPERAPWRPATGIGPQVSDAELVTLAVMQPCSGLPARRAGCGIPPPTAPCQAWRSAGLIHRQQASSSIGVGPCAAVAASRSSSTPRTATRPS